MDSPSLSQLVESTQYLFSQMAAHPEYKQLQDLGYSPDLNIADAETALIYLQCELDQNKQHSN
ncbi:hypothetical protein [Nostoc sp. MG11]|uniref:hypothetical protein n=1 Tax=Nostoc sp. MG11 TaxID=2721166 RepID=UPI0018681EAE|nr:hypothetical protein [Nostoc sp. MG11]